MSAVMYGIADKIPDSTLTEDIIKGVLSSFLEVVPPEYIHEAQQQHHHPGAKGGKEGAKGKKYSKKKWLS